MGRPIYAPGGLGRIWAKAGLVNIDQRSPMIRMDFADFADYWQPFASGEGALGAYVATLGDGARGRLERHLREAYLTGLPDGERSFAAVALSCRGVVPVA
jgi:hypothetical protein